MNNEWTELKTLQEVAAAQERGDEIEIRTKYVGWSQWMGYEWQHTWKFRSRPQKKVKKIVLREALMRNATTDYFWTQWYSEQPNGINFVRWLDSEPREIEVEE